MTQTNLNKLKTTEKISWRLKEASEATGLSVPFLRKKIRQKELKTVTVGSCVLIMDSELKRFLTQGET